MKYAEKKFRSCDSHAGDCTLNTEVTDATLQCCLNRLAQAADDADARQIVRELLSVAAGRIFLLCEATLNRHYPRLIKGPFNVQPQELLGAVTERLIKAMRNVRPTHLREFFALAMKHIRWELNGLARELDANRLEHLATDVIADDPEANEEQFSPLGLRILDAINDLSEIDRDIFNLVRLGGMTQPDAAEVLGISERTVHRRLRRILPYLWAKLGEFQPAQATEFLRHKTLRPDFGAAEGSIGKQSPTHVA